MGFISYWSSASIVLSFRQSAMYSGRCLLDSRQLNFSLSKIKWTATRPDHWLNRTYQTNPTEHAQETERSRHREGPEELAGPV
jgi:hypothetical protein